MRAVDEEHEYNNKAAAAVLEMAECVCSQGQKQLNGMRRVMLIVLMDERNVSGRLFATLPEGMQSSATSATARMQQTTVPLFEYINLPPTL